MHSLELRILEHIKIMEDEKVSTSCLCVTWKLPPSDLIKLNVDVAMAMAFSTSVQHSSQ